MKSMAQFDAGVSGDPIPNFLGLEEFLQLGVCTSE